MNAVPALTREQIREIDRLAIEEFGIAGVVLMENAGRNAANIIIEQIDHPHRPLTCIFCGRGNNGGDGFVIARHLHNAHFPVEIVLLADPQELSGDAAVNHRIIERMNLPIHAYDPQDAAECVKRCEVIVDALLGTGFTGEVRPPIDQAIHLINGADHAFRIAVDVPSGLDCDSGRPAAATVRAHLTITFVAEKVGFQDADDYTGNIVVVDIGAPRQLLERHGR